MVGKKNGLEVETDGKGGGEGASSATLSCWTFETLRLGNVKGGGERGDRECVFEFLWYFFLSICVFLIHTREPWRMVPGVRGRVRPLSGFVAVPLLLPLFLFLVCCLFLLVSVLATILICSARCSRCVILQILDVFVCVAGARLNQYIAGALLPPGRREDRLFYVFFIYSGPSSEVCPHCFLYSFCVRFLFVCNYIDIRPDGFFDVLIFHLTTRRVRSTTTTGRPAGCKCDN